MFLKMGVHTDREKDRDVEGDFIFLVGVFVCGGQKLPKERNVYST
jgi:hypothetical protein